MFTGEGPGVHTRAYPDFVFRDHKTRKQHQNLSALTSGMPDNYGCPGFGSVDFKRTLAGFFLFVSSMLARNQGAS